MILRYYTFFLIDMLKLQANGYLFNKIPFLLVLCFMKYFFCFISDLVFCRDRSVSIEEIDSKTVFLFSGIGDLLFIEY